MSSVDELQKKAKKCRQILLKMVYDSKGVAHLGGSLSAMDMAVAVYDRYINDFKDPNRCRFVLSKGHASPIYYSVLSQLGYFPKKDLMTFRIFGTLLQGHPAPFCPGVEVATGSLGQGLSIACGIALALKLDKNPAHVFVLMGDGELQEGNVWEGFMNARVLVV